MDPPPDLVAEVDITSSSLDRLGIYAALKVPEIWHYNGTIFRVLVLSASGKYRAKAKSPTFPWLPIKEFSKFLNKLGTVDEVELIQAYIDWLRARVLPRKQAAEARRNGNSP